MSTEEMLNERTTDGKTEYKCCHCNEWKAWEKMSHNIWWTNQPQYECLDCIKTKFSTLIINQIFLNRKRY